VKASLSSLPASRYGFEQTLIQEIPVHVGSAFGAPGCEDAHRNGVQLAVPGMQHEGCMS